MNDDGVKNADAAYEAFDDVEEVDKAESSWEGKSIDAGISAEDCGLALIVPAPKLIDDDDDTPLLEAAAIEGADGAEAALTCPLPLPLAMVSSC